MVKLNGYIFDWGWRIVKKYNIWNDITNSIKQELDSEAIFNKRFLKTKIKSYSDEATDFHDKEIT